jgi:hypothetical protein
MSAMALNILLNVCSGSTHTPPLAVQASLIKIGIFSSLVALTQMEKLVVSTKNFKGRIDMMRRKKI